MKKYVVVIGFLTALAACQVAPVPEAKKLVGLVEIQFSGVGENAKASLKNIDLRLRTTALNDLTAGLDFKPLSNGAFDTGTRTVDGKRYLWASFKVRNANSSGVAYGAAKNNLSFVAVSMPSTINQTAISTLKNFDGSAANPTIARTILPTHGMELDLASRKAVPRANTQDLQFYTETEAAALKTVLNTPTSVVDSVLPYGFVVRNISTPDSRTLPANPSATEYAGTVTFAVQIPLQSSTAADPFYISLKLAVVENTDTNVSKSLEESVNSAKTRSLELTGANTRNACTGVRVAGNTPADPLNTVITDAPSAGDLDYCNFANFGVANIPSNSPRMVAVQSDRKIIVAGDKNNSGQSDIILERFNTDGTPDPTFGTAGTATIDSGSSDNIKAISMQSDGKIVIAGTKLVSSYTIWLLARLTAGGELDTTFGGSSCPCSGYTTASFSVLNADHNVSSVLLLPGDKILVGGADRNPNVVDTKVGLMQFTSTGVLDTTFSTSGKVSTDVGLGNLDEAVAMVRQSSGQIVVAAKSIDQSNSNNGEVLVRYSAAGVLDTTFGSSGILTVAQSTSQPQGGDLVQQSDGKLLHLRQSYNGSSSDYVLKRFNSSGTTDTTFATSGQYTLDLAGLEDSPVSVLLQSDAKILIVGAAETAPASNPFGDPPKNVVTVRLTSGGALDTTYGTNGIASTDVSGGRENQVQKAVLDSLNRVIVLSFDNSGMSSYQGLSRFVP